MSIEARVPELEAAQKHGATRMRLRSEIERVFEGKAFNRPLFYTYGGGLRFGLSDGGSAIDQLLLAIQKAREICSDVFDPGQFLVACFRVRGKASRHGNRPMLRELRAAGVKIPRERCVWSESVPADDRIYEGIEEYLVNVAFEAPTEVLQRLLWCALAKDFGSIRPRPLCDVYLFELSKGVMIFPYDDRGIDVVGPNHALLARLYRRHSQYILECDRASMEVTFGSL